MLSIKPALRLAFIPFLLLIVGCSSSPPPIVNAVAAGNLQQVESYLNAGVNPNTTWYTGALIHIAANRGNAEMVDLLLRNGADPFKKYSWEQISIHRATSLDVVDRLLDAGVPIDYRDEDRDTLLTLRARNASPDFIQGLIDRGANVNAAQEDGWTPLQLAARYNNANVVEVLLQNGAEIDRANRFGSNPIWLAIHAENKDAVEVLLKYGASIDIDTASESILEKADESESMSASWLRERQRFYQEDYEDFVQQQQIARQQEEMNAAQQQAQQRLLEMEQRDAALPPQIQRDKYLVAFSNAMKELNYSDANLYATLLERTGLPVDNSLYYFWGEALLEMGDTDAARQKLTQYLNLTGTAGQYYAQTLSLMLEAESR